MTVRRDVHQRGQPAGQRPLVVVEHRLLHQRPDGRQVADRVDAATPDQLADLGLDDVDAALAVHPQAVTHRAPFLRTHRRGVRAQSVVNRATRLDLAYRPVDRRSPRLAGLWTSRPVGRVRRQDRQPWTSGSPSSSTNGSSSGGRCPAGTALGRRGGRAGRGRPLATLPADCGLVRRAAPPLARHRSGLPPLLDGAVVSSRRAHRDDVARPGPALPACHVGPDAGSVFPLASGTHRLGRAAGTESAHRRPGPVAQHLEIAVGAAARTVTDLTTTNGSRLAGRRARARCAALGGGRATVARVIGPGAANPRISLRRNDTGRSGPSLGQPSAARATAGRRRRGRGSPIAQATGRAPGFPCSPCWCRCCSPCRWPGCSTRPATCCSA